jgi:hypothetical protein
MKYFLSLDFLSPSPQIYYLTNLRYNNTFGTIVSILTLIILIFFCLYFLSSFIIGTNPLIYSYVEPIYSSELDLSNKQIRFKLIDQNNKEINPRIAEVIPFLTGITNSSIENNFPLNTSKCSINDLINRDKNYHTDLSMSFSPLYLSNYTCISNKMNSFSKLSFNNSFQSYITAYVAKCTNTTKNNRHCLSSEEIDIYLIKNKIYLLIYIDNVWVNHTKKDPFIKNYSFRKIEIDLNFYYKYYYSFQEVKYSSDNGIMFKNIKDNKMFVFDSNNNYNTNSQNNIGNYKIGTPKTLYINYPNCIMEVVFSLNKEFRLTYIRAYQKLHSVFSNSGGCCFIIIFISKFIVFAFTNGKMFVEIFTIKNKLESKIKSTFIKDQENNKSNETSIGNTNHQKLQYLSIENVNLGGYTYSQNNNNSSNNDSSMKILSSLNNNNISSSIVNYAKFSKEKELSKIKDKLNDKNNKSKSPKKKTISYCDSFIYLFTCTKTSSMRCNFIKFCELTVKTKLSSDELIFKLNDLELLINLNLKDIKPPLIGKETIDLLVDEKTNLIEIKEISENSSVKDENDNENEKDNYKIENTNSLKENSSNIKTNNIISND